jgi:hypothetical protein
MTRYTVVWDKEVEELLLNAWLAADSQRRAILTSISDWIDSELAIDPEIKGHSLSDSEGRIVEASVSNSNLRASVTYRVFPQDRQVRITLLVIRAA